MDEQTATAEEPPDLLDWGVQGSGKEATIRVQAGRVTCYYNPAELDRVIAQAERWLEMLKTIRRQVSPLDFPPPT